jgi:hypothetical protein
LDERWKRGARANPQARPISSEMMTYPSGLTGVGELARKLARRVSGVAGCPVGHTACALPVLACICVLWQALQVSRDALAVWSGAA